VRTETGGIVKFNLECLNNDGWFTNKDIHDLQSRIRTARCQSIADFVRFIDAFLTLKNPNQPFFLRMGGSFAFDRPPSSPTDKNRPSIVWDLWHFEPRGTAMRGSPMSGGEFVHPGNTGHGAPTALFSLRATRVNFERKVGHGPDRQEASCIIGTQVTIHGSYESSKPSFLTKNALNRYDDSHTAFPKNESTTLQPEFLEPLRNVIDAAADAWEQCPDRSPSIITHEKLSSLLKVIFHGVDIGYLAVSSQFENRFQSCYCAPVNDSPRHASQGSSRSDAKRDHCRAYSTSCGITSTTAYSTSASLQDGHCRQAWQRSSSPGVVMVGYLNSLIRPSLHNGFASVLRSDQSTLGRQIAPPIMAVLEVNNSTQWSKYSTSFGIAKDGYPSDFKSPELEHRQHCAFLALGSNVGDRLLTIEDACRAIDAEPGVSIKRTSGLWETKAMYITDQDDFLNGVCEVSTLAVAIRARDTKITKKFSRWLGSFSDVNNRLKQI